ncbi:MAG: hypothetical protein IJN88_03960 [Clostridia bacterium]|nr:hypothetical protein [Clostridia bacterium]
MTNKRIILFAGHYGSGKTNIAVNFSVRLKEEGFPVLIADLDIVNPYFRTKDSEKELAEKGIELICSEFANTNLDIPSLPKNMYRVVNDKKFRAVMDIGGDDAGAIALGRFAPFISEENDYEMIFVANFFRPLTRSAEEAYEVMQEIEAASSLKFTAIVNNSNLGSETTAEDIVTTFDETEKLSSLSSLPVLFTSCEKKLCEKIKNNGKVIFPLELQSKIF